MLWLSMNLTRILTFNSLFPNYWIPTRMEDCDYPYGATRDLIINDKWELLNGKLS